MFALTLALWVVSFLVELALLSRARTTRSLSELPLFYSYIAYMLLGSFATFLVFLLRPGSYPSAYWLFYLIGLLAEFLVLVEVSDGVFRPYPALRYLGRLVVILVSLAFSVFFVFAMLLHAPSSNLALLALRSWASLAKAAIIGGVILTARYYRLPLSRPAAGLMTGLVLYLGVYATTSAAGQAFGEHLSTYVLRFIDPIGWLVCLLTWTVTLWRPELDTEKDRVLHTQPDWVLSHEIDRLNGALSKRLGR